MENYEPLAPPSVFEQFLFGWNEEERLRQELAKKNYLDIHQKRKKKR